jgi:general secretion pathway protein M
MKQTWYGASSRDQKSVMALAIALVLSFVVFGVIQPISNANEKMEADLNSANRTLTELVALAPKAMSTGGGQSGTVTASSINTETRRQAARYGVEILKYETDGDLFKVWLEDSRYPSVIQWLGALEAMGISHLELTLEDRPKPGFVSVRVTFGLTQ